MIYLLILIFHLTLISSNIASFSFFCIQRKKFEIRGVNWPSNEKYVYYTTSDEKSKHLLSLCKVTHQYSMAIQPRLAQVRGREESGKPNFTVGYPISNL